MLAGKFSFKFQKILTGFLRHRFAANLVRKRVNQFLYDHIFSFLPSSCAVQQLKMLLTWRFILGWMLLPKLGDEDCMLTYGILSTGDYSLMNELSEVIVLFM